jgi:hypothetical protein
MGYKVCPEYVENALKLFGQTEFFFIFRIVDTAYCKGKENISATFSWPSL